MSAQCSHWWYRILVPSLSTILSPVEIGLTPPRQLELKLDAFTDRIKSDKPVVYYPAAPSSPGLIIGNDGSAKGGFKLWGLPPQKSNALLRELGSCATGRTKLVTIVYDIGGSDWVITIAQPDSRFRFFQILKDHRLEQYEVEGAARTVLGDWSALCGWRSTETGLQYLYLFGKGKAVVLLVRTKRAKKGTHIEMVEVCM